MVKACGTVIVERYARRKLKDGKKSDKYKGRTKKKRNKNGERRRRRICIHTKKKNTNARGNVRETLQSTFFERFSAVTFVLISAVSLLPYRLALGAFREL